MKPIELKSFSANKELCPVSQIRHYLNMIAGICGVFIKLFISYTPLHVPVTTSTLSWWCRLILQKAGIDRLFTSHSTRAASISKAYSTGMSLAEIHKAAGWSGSCTFAKYYQRPIDENLGECLLSSLNN